MKLDSPLLIVSDIHIGHTASTVSEPEQLAPLFRNFSTVVFNGDTVEMLVKAERPAGLRNQERLGKICLEQGALPIFINGNHDPMASSANHLDLHGEAVLVTHGDGLFHDIAPWGREAEITGQAHEKILKSLSPAALANLDDRLIAVRRASTALEMHDFNYPKGRFACLRLVVRESWPPWRALRILKYWMQTPQRASMFAHIFRPFARFVVIGHTHKAGIWRCDGRQIINTGSFLPLSGRLAVLIEGRSLQVRKIQKRSKRFCLGKTVATFQLPRLTAMPRTSSHRNGHATPPLRRGTPYRPESLTPQD